jgi:hypothetical protein
LAGRNSQDAFMIAREGFRRRMSAGVKDERMLAGRLRELLTL